MNSNSFSCTLAVLVRNEIVGSREMFDKIAWSSFEQVLVVDGSSTDGTREFYEQRNIPVLVQKRRGLGAAMLEAREACTTDAIIFFHPDGNEDPADILTIRKLLAEGAEFAVASRMITGSWNEEDDTILKFRKWANQGFAVIANILWARKGNRTTDVTNGMRGIRVSAWDRMQLTSTDLTMDYQMVIRALKRGIRISELPTREGHRIAGATNFASWSTGVAELKLVWRELRGR